MGFFRFNRVTVSPDRFRDNFRPHMATCLAGLIILTGCVADTTLPSQNVGVLLTPDENQTAGQSTKPSGTLALTASQPSTTPTLSPTVKNALIPGNSAASPAQKAVSEVAQSETSGEQTASGNTEPTARKQNSLFGSLFSNTPKNSPQAGTKPADRPKTKLARLSATPATKNKQNSNQRRRPRIKATIRDGALGLPGVRIKKLFGIDTQETEEFDEPLNVANVPNLARRGTHGLLLQRPDVKVGCFPRRLLSILKRVERRFGRTPIVTSGYRSPSYNRRVRGARNSTHVSCRAADIQVKGVSKWKLAKYLRTIPGRGGVGTYCHTKSVHIDIGKKRAWHYCKRSRKKRRRS